MKKKLGRTGIRVCPVGFGGIPIQRLSVKETDSLISHAVDMGMEFFDTARIYADSEEKMGRILSKYRNRVKIATKTYARTGVETLKDLETSLRMLKTDHIDLYLCHNLRNEKDIDDICKPGSTLDVIQSAVKKGKIRHAGFSTHKPWVAEQAISQFDFEVVEIPFNYIETSAQDSLIPLLKKKEIGTIAMKPMAGGAFKNTSLNLRFILTSGIDVAIPGMDFPDQIEQNLSVLSPLTPLNGEEIQKLESEKQELGDSFCRRCEYCMPCPQELPISFLHLIKAYYFRYNLKDWAWDRLGSLPKSFQDCIACGECISKCPYDLNTPEIFKDTWEKILEDRKN